VERLITVCRDALLERGLVVRTLADPRRRAGVLAFEHQRAAELAAFLRSRGVDIGGYDWGLGRIDPHAFNNEADIQRLLTTLDSFLLSTD
jgi:hypothetical protein